MKIINFRLFENTPNQTQGNTYGMGNVKAPQPASEPGKVNELPSEKKRVPEPEEPTQEPQNESIKNFYNFHLNEEGMVTAGNTAGMGNVSSPVVSTDGSINTYSGNGSPTSSAASGSGDRVGRIGGVAKKAPAPKFKKSKNRPPKCETIIPFNDFFSTKVTENQEWLTEYVNESIRELGYRIDDLDERIINVETITSHLKPE